MLSMSSTAERAGSIGWAAFLTIPAFEFFTWCLDTYGRVEVLVKLHDHLPQILISPMSGFLAMAAAVRMSDSLLRPGAAAAWIATRRKLEP